MNSDDVYRWILKHKQNYPGKHLSAQPRTNPAHKPLEPLSQFHLIMRSTYAYIKENMQAGRGVNIRALGAFCFEVKSGLIKPAQLVQFDLSKSLEQQRLERKHIHQIRPCFVPNKEFKYALKRYPGKEEITKPHSQHSIYQKGFGMIFCNPVPIAMSCYLGKNTVVSAHKAFFKAICNLTQLGYNLRIDMGFCTLCVTNKNLSYSYRNNFSRTLNRTTYEFQLRQSDKSCKKHWTSRYKNRWNKSTLNSQVCKPNNNLMKTQYQKTLALKIMSLDMNTATKTNYSQIRGKLPKIKKPSVVNLEVVGKGGQ